jgi:4'-phosphopantetheinyl transferase
MLFTALAARPERWERLAVSHTGPAPSALWRLPANEVHVWRARLDRLIEDESTRAALLSADEKERAARFYRQLDRDRFVVTRELLRFILSRYLDASPSSLRFVKNEHGKPCLTGSGEALSFNVSHSGNVVLLAFARRRALGVDVERLDATVDCDRLAKRLFSPAELAQLAHFTGAEERVRAFFRCWTRKEAYIKGQGAGMALGLRSFDVTLDRGEPVRLLATRPDPQEARRWQLRNLQPAHGYAAALAVEGWNWRMRRRTWDRSFYFL